MKATIYLLAILLAVSLPLSGANETWTSSTGSAIEGRYLGSGESLYWIIGKDGRLFKLKEAQLSQESMLRIQEIDAKKAMRIERGERLSVLVPKVANPANEEVVKDLASFLIPTIRFDGVSVESAIETMVSDMSSPPSIDFADENAAQRKVQIQLRNLYADQMLDHMLTQVGLYYEVIDGGVVVQTK